MTHSVSDPIRTQPWRIDASFASWRSPTKDLVLLALQKLAESGRIGSRTPQIHTPARCLVIAFLNRGENEKPVKLASKPLATFSVADNMGAYRSKKGPRSANYCMIGKGGPDLTIHFPRLANPIQASKLPARNFLGL